MFKKILVFYSILLFTSSFFFIAAPAHAANLTFTPQVTVPGYTADFTSKSTAPIGEYIKAIYKYAIGVVGIIATVVMMFGGVLWLLAGGDSGKISEAKSWITAAITGLGLAVGSYLILATVNPDLVNFKISGIASVVEPTIANDDDLKKAMKACDDSCHAKGKGSQYDPTQSPACSCLGEGSHMGCVQNESMGAGGVLIKTNKCQAIPYKGVSSCQNDSDCIKKLGCCRCGGLLYTYGCFSGPEYTNITTCKSKCNYSFDFKEFTLGALCDSNKKCIPQ